MTPSVRVAAVVLAFVAALAVPWLATTGAPVSKRAEPAEPVRFGVATAAQYLADPRYRETVRQTFDSITPEAAMKFGLIHPCPPVEMTELASERYEPALANWIAADPNDRCDGSATSEWDWTPMDRLVLWARRENIAVYGHTLLWHTQNPPWLVDVPLRADQLEWIMVRHIETVISRYCHDIYAYDVVNEGIAPDGSLLELGPWYRVPNYIDKAFRAARRTLESCHISPEQVSLLYNDFEIEYDRSLPYEAFVARPGSYNKSEAVYDYLAALLSGENPTPIDGIGLQSHLRLEAEPTEAHRHDGEALNRVLREFGALGLEIKITEIDVPIYRVNPTASLDEQASLFGDVAERCSVLRHCTGFTVWGLRDAHSWRGEEAAPLLFSNEPCGDTYCAKPALSAVKKALRQFRR